MSQVLEQDVTPQQAPSPRDARGRFASGNQGGPGNPFGRRLAAMREAVQQAVTVEDIAQLMQVLLAKALTGDLAAAKLVLQYAVGKPKPVAEPDRVEVDAWELNEQSWTPAKTCNELMAGIPTGIANVMLDATAAARTETLGAALTDPQAAAALFAAADEEDDDNRPLTPEEIAEAKREWIEANERVARMNAADRPSPTATNGDHGSGRPVF